jgi:hypothetical protein
LSQIDLRRCRRGDLLGLTVNGAEVVLQSMGVANMWTVRTRIPAFTRHGIVLWDTLVLESKVGSGQPLKVQWAAQCGLDLGRVQHARLERNGATTAEF